MVIARPKSHRLKAAQLATTALGRIEVPLRHLTLPVYPPLRLTGAVAGLMQIGVIGVRPQQQLPNRLRAA